jgi:hypothetical protein
MAQYIGDHNQRCRGASGMACYDSSCPCACHYFGDGLWRTFEPRNFVIIGTRENSVRDSKNQMRRQHQENEFEVRERKAHMFATLTTFGTSAQARSTFEKVKSELALQGLNMEFTDVRFE